MPSDSLPQSLDAAIAGGTGPVIALLAPVSDREAFSPLPRPPLAWLRNRARRRLNGLAWRAGMKMAWHHSTYEDHAHTNRGDIAIGRASLALLRGAFGGRARVADIGWAEWPAAAEWVARHADVCVLGGGGYFYLHDGGRLAERVARDVALLTALRCPLVSLSPGVNRLLSDAAAPLHPDSADVLRRMLDRLAISTVRDRPSRDLLDTVAPGHSRVLADPALFLAPDGPAAPHPPPGLTIGLNLAFHGPASSRALPARMRLLIGAAQALRRLGARFRYFVHSEAERAIPPLLRAAGLDVQTIDAPAEAMLRHYAGLDLHVCQMLHSGILAANAGVPFVMLGYDMKNAAFAELMGLSDYCLPADAVTPAGLDAAIASALAHRAALAAALAVRKRSLRTEMDAVLSDIAGLAPRAG